MDVHQNVAYQKQHQQAPQSQKILKYNNTIKLECTPLGKPIESMLNKLVHAKLINLLESLNRGEPSFKLSWYDDNAYCEYHSTKGHDMLDCIKLKNLIQDLIDQREITVEDNDQDLTINEYIK